MRCHSISVCRGGGGEELCQMLFGNREGWRLSDDTNIFHTATGDDLKVVCETNAGGGPRVPWPPKNVVNVFFLKIIYLVTFF